MSNFELNIVFENNILYVGTECGSGATYKCKSLDQVKEKINEYIDTYIKGVGINESKK